MKKSSSASVHIQQLLIDVPKSTAACAFAGKIVLMASLPRRGPQNAPQLSCDLCRERKVKCDKLDPCTNCTAAGVTCRTIYRNRLPRGRHARSSTEDLDPPASRATGQAREDGAAAAAQAANQELRERIESLETLILSMSKQESTSPTSNHTTLDRQVSHTSNISPPARS